jgi:EmrB/QacA subfamily drug resistance transporter
MQTESGTKPLAQEEEIVLTFPDGRKVNPWLVLLSLIVGLFMALLDATIVNVAFNAIQTELNSDPTTTSWVLNAYSLTFAVLLVTAGRLADQFGRKRIFMLGMIFFSLGSLLCATAPSIEWLITFRAVQAVGASALNPISLAIITIAFPPHKRGAAIGMWGALTGLAMGLGPVIGGFLVENFEWRSIFFVNLPFCLAGLLMVWRFVPENFDANAPRSLDYIGTVLMSVSLLCLVMAIMQGNDWGWSDGRMLALFGGAFLALTLFILAELKQKYPIIDFRLFKTQSFTASNLAMFLFGVGIQAGMLILVLYLIMARGYTELNAAYALLPMPVAGFVASGIFGSFSRKADLRLVGIVGILMSGGGLLLLAQIEVEASYWEVAWRAIFVGIGLGVCFMTYSTIVLSEVPHSKVGVGSGVFNTFRQIGFALGVAILMSFFTEQMKDNLNTARAHAIALVRVESSIPPVAQEMIVQQLEKMGGTMTSRGQGGGQSLDLAVMTAKLPDSAAIKPQLNKLSEQLGAEIKGAVVKSFTATWWLGGLILLSGLIPGIFARSRQPVENKPEVMTGAV